MAASEAIRDEAFVSSKRFNLKLGQVSDTAVSAYENDTMVLQPQNMADYRAVEE